MHSVDIRNVNMGQIQCFLAVVDFNSFTKAAGAMHIVQSTVSKSINSLENMLGLQLFIRDKNTIHVTPAGKILYERWKNLARDAEKAVIEAHVIQTGQHSNISVVGLDSYNPSTVIMPAINNFKSKYPEVSVKVETMPAEEVRRTLINGESDIAFTVLYDIEQLGSKDFEYEELAVCPHYACMLKTNALSKCKKLNVSDLRQSNFISISPLKTPSYSIAVEQLCKKYGFIPNITHYTQGASALAFNLTTDKDVFICDRFFKDFGDPEIVAVPLEDTKSGIVIGWKKSNEKKEAKLFVSVTLKMIENKPI